MRNWKLPVFGTLAYIVAGSGWILAGYFLSGALYDDTPAARFELAKGMAYVGITAAILFIVLTYLDRKSAADELIPGDLGEAFSQSLRRGDFVVRWLPRLVALLFIAILTIVAGALYWVREDTLHNGSETALALQRVHAAQMDNALDVINLTLREIANDVASGGIAIHESSLQRHMPDLASSVSSLLVTDHLGMTLANTNVQAARLNLADRDYFRHHRDTADSGFHLSTPLVGAASGQWRIIASRAVRSRDGRFMGIVAAVIDPTIFGAYWRQSSPQGNTVSIYDEAGTLLLRSPYLDSAIGNTKASAIFPETIRQPGGTVTFRARSVIDNEQRIYAAGLLTGYPHLRLVVGIPEARLLKDWQTFAVVSLAIYLLVAGGLSALTFELLRQMRERLVLQRKAAELARYPLQNRNPVLTVTPAGRKLFLNNAARELANSSAQEAAELDRQLLKIAATTQPGTHEFAVGNRIFTASYVPHPPDYCDIYLTDITSQRSGENLLHLFFDLPFIGMAITSPETRQWRRFNEQLCTILGYTRSELEQKTWAELTHPDDLAADVAEFDRVMRDESDSYTIEKRFIRKDGGVINTVIDVHAIRRANRSVDYFVATIQDVTERKLAEQKLREQRDLYAALTGTNEAIIRIRDRNALLARVCEVAAGRTGITFSWAGGIGESGAITPIAKSGDDHGILERAVVNTQPGMPTECAAAARAIAGNRIEVVNRWEDDPKLAPWLELFAEAGFQSLAVLPIRENGIPVATLHLYSNQRDYFQKDVVDLLARMRADLDYALDSMRTEAERRHAVTELESAEARWQLALESGDHGVWDWNIREGTVFFSNGWKSMLGYAPHEISGSVSEWESRVHPDDLAHVMNEVKRYLNGEIPHYRCEHRVRCKDGSYKWILDQGKITRRDSTGAPLVMTGTHTDLTERMQTESALRESELKFKSLVEQSLIGIYMVDGESMIYANPRTEEIFGYAPGELPGTPLDKLVTPEDIELVKNNIALRLSGQTETIRYEFRGLRKDGSVIDIGVHGSHTRIGGRSVVLGVLQDITERRLHEEKVRSYVEKLERSIMSTVQAISQMVDLRDPYTSGHERRVGELSAAIGAELGMTEHQLTGLRIAGNVHDVGKIAVPAEILSKPTRLSPAEFAIVKTHAQQGYEILKDIEFPWPVVSAVHQHHERLDGSGYPQGLRGDAICIEARILAVADVVESMTTHRPYRPALGLDAALAELHKNSGILYDAAVVDTCIKLFREKGYTLPQ